MRVLLVSIATWTDCAYKLDLTHFFSGIHLDSEQSRPMDDFIDQSFVETDFSEQVHCCHRAENSFTFFLNVSADLQSGDYALTSLELLLQGPSSPCLVARMDECCSCNLLRGSLCWP